MVAVSRRRRDRFGLPQSVGEIRNEGTLSVRPVARRLRVNLPRAHPYYCLIVHEKAGRYDPH